jgi:hypothetical protein
MMKIHGPSRVEGSPMLRSLALVVAVAATATPVFAAPGTGSITGTVTWKGEAPAAAPVDRSSDPVCAATARGKDDVLVTDGKLRDVVVRVTAGAVAPATAPPTPVVIAQSECMYAPRVSVAIAGQSLEVRNLDNTFHNVRGNRLAKVLWNLGQPKGAPPIVRDLKAAAVGEVISLHCDVHPWMAAWVVVSDHAAFAVTGADGAFTLRDLAPGTYTVEAWHPTLGKKTAKVKVKKGKKPAKLAFTFAAP